MQKHFWKEHLFSLQAFLFALVSRLVRARAKLIEGAMSVTSAPNTESSCSTWQLPAICVDACTRNEYICMYVCICIICMSVHVCLRLYKRCDERVHNGSCSAS